MPITRKKKTEILQDLNEKLPKSKIAILMNFSGLSMDKIIELRKGTEAHDAEFKVTKNNLLKIAVKENNLEIQEEVIQGPMAIIFGFRDEVEPAKILAKLATDEKKPEMILGAIYENKFVPAETVRALSKIPGRDILEARLVGNLNAPISNLVWSLKYNLFSLTSILKQYHNQLTVNSQQ